MPLTTKEKESLTDGFKAAGERMESIETTVEELKKFGDELTRRMRSLLQSGVSAEDYRGFWMYPEQAREFGELVLTVIRNKAMGEGTQPGGGMLVPTELAKFFLEKLGSYGKFRRDTVVLPMGSSEIKIPRLDTDITVYCPGEGRVIPKSDPKGSQVGLVLKKWAALIKISRELEEDAIIAVGEIVGRSLIRSIAKKEDEVGFVGDGTSTYFGMTGIVGALRNVDVTIGNIKSLVVASGNSYSEITLGDFRKVIGVLPADADETAKWYMHKRFYYDVVWPLAETAGVANIFEILSNRKDRYLLGYPVEFVHCMPYEEDDSQICAILGDLSMGSYLGQRNEVLQIDRSDQVYFETAEVGIRGIERIDINVYGVGDTSEAGPICGLITAAS